ncbi:unnamed protein product [Caretta caretta]
MTKAGTRASAAAVGGKDWRHVAEEEQMGSSASLGVVEEERVQYNTKCTCLRNREESGTEGQSDRFPNYRTECDDTDSCLEQTEFQLLTLHTPGLETFVSRFTCATSQHKFNSSSAHPSQYQLLLLPGNKIGSMQPRELRDILIKPGYPSNYTALETLLRNYEDIDKIGTVLDGLNQQVNRTNGSLKAVLNGVWPSFVTALSSFNSSSLDQWLKKRLQTHLPLITPSQLNTSEILTTNCLAFRHLVKALNIHYHDYTVEMQRSIYIILKNYLLQPEQLQDFAVDPRNLALVRELTLSEDVKEYYSTLISMQNPSIGLGR